LAQAKAGDTVLVHYTGSFDDGAVFDSSLDGEPLEFTVGQGEVIPGFDNAVDGLDEGETRTVSIPPDEAYGNHRDDLVAVIGREQLPTEIDPEVGLVLEMSSEDGIVTNVTITEIGDDTITLDANHELAGKKLNFEITLVEILAA
jgi:peptidylprolyl isomerase